MRPDRIRFSCHSSAFEVEVSGCVNPECECGELTFGLIEEGAGREGMRLAITVDVERWEECRVPPGRTDQQAAMVREFLRDYPESERAEWREHVRRQQAGARRLREYRVDPAIMRSGELVSYLEVCSPSGGPGGKDWSEAWSGKLDGAKYLIEDSYCPRPACHCREALLRFLEVQRDGRTMECGESGEQQAVERIVLKELFTARVSLSGKVKIEERRGVSKGYAGDAVAQWRSEPGNLEEMAWRYEKMKEIGRRSGGGAGGTAAGERLTAEDLDARAAAGGGEERRVGRNDPCPCGSGRKYKKCCGR